MKTAPLSLILNIVYIQHFNPISPHIHSKFNLAHLVLSCYIHRKITPSFIVINSFWVYSRQKIFMLFWLNFPLFFPRGVSSRKFNLRKIYDFIEISDWIQIFHIKHKTLSCRYLSDKNNEKLFLSIVYTFSNWNSSSK